MVRRWSNSCLLASIPSTKYKVRSPVESEGRGSIGGLRTREIGHKQHGESGAMCFICSFILAQCLAHCRRWNNVRRVTEGKNQKRKKEASLQEVVKTRYYLTLYVQSHFPHYADLFKGKGILSLYLCILRTCIKRYPDNVSAKWCLFKNKWVTINIRSLWSQRIYRVRWRSRQKNLNITQMKSCSGLIIKTNRCFRDILRRL